jgi:hypothetical protein
MESQDHGKWKAKGMANGKRQPPVEPPAGDRSMSIQVDWRLLACPV